jgi:molybdate transport system permease protein
MDPRFYGGDARELVLILTPTEWGIVALSLKIGLVAMAATLPVAFALAFLLARGSFPGKVVLDAVIHLPLVLPPVVTGWLLLLAFAPAGPIGGALQDWFGATVLFRWTGAAIAAGVMALPLMVRAMRLSIEAVDRRLESAARTLGAGRTRVFATVTLPLSVPGVLAGCVLGFARSIGEFGATITFVSNVPGETRTLPLAIYSALQLPEGNAEVLRLALVSVALSLGALIVSELLARRSGRGMHVV